MNIIWTWWTVFLGSKSNHRNPQKSIFLIRTQQHQNNSESVSQLQDSDWNYQSLSRIQQRRLGFGHLFCWILKFFPFSDLPPILSKGNFIPLPLCSDMWCYYVYACDVHKKMIWDCVFKMIFRNRNLDLYFVCDFL
jgi:hypothetical protein